jgi:hypothetical protein
MATAARCRSAAVFSAFVDLGLRRTWDFRRRFLAGGLSRHGLFLRVAGVSSGNSIEQDNSRSPFVKGILSHQTSQKTHPGDEARDMVDEMLEAKQEGRRRCRNILRPLCYFRSTSGATGRLA